ncbi:hypothetical protein ACF0H5_012540 [Mactra antiquata]
MWMDIYLTVTLVLAAAKTIKGQGNDCPGGGRIIGEGNPKSKDDTIDSNVGFGYMMGDPDFDINCCGVIENVKVSSKNIVSSQQLYILVWRPSSGGSYTLVGKTSVTVTENDAVVYPFATSEQPTVIIGDLWGWWTSGADIVTYKGGNGEEDANYMMSLADQTVGAVVNWGGANIENDRTYGIYVETFPNDPPSFSNLPATVSVAAGSGSGTNLITLTVNDVNTYDISTLAVARITTNTRYSFDSSTSTSFPTTSDVDELVFTVTDICNNVVTGTVTISITNQPPVINSLPASVSIVEDETAEILHHIINVTDVESTYLPCSFDSLPDGYPFTIKLIPSTTSFGIYSNANPGFVYNTLNTYTLTVQCTDGEFTDSKDFIVYISQNAAPVFVNLQNSTSVTTTSAVGSNAFTVLATDAESDDLIFTMTCSPTPCPFVIFNSGEIQISEDLSTHTTVGYDLNITVSDGRNTVGPSSLTITIADLNDPVVINNLPITRVVAENSAIGTSVFDVNFTDIDTSQPHSFSMSSTPTDGLTYLDIDPGTGVVSVITSPNFESLATTTFVFNVTVTDPVTSDSGLMTIQVTNVNEAPSFGQAAYSLSTTESGSGTLIGTPSFGITDPDSGDSYTLALDCGTETGYFSMNSSTGAVSFQSNYDLDTGSLPTTVSCTVTVTDAAGLVDTASLTINIDYINDNTPVFSPASYVFYVSYFADVGTSIGTVTATDADGGGDGVLTYSLNQTSLSNQYFDISNTGAITLRTSLNGSPLGHSVTVTITSTATDPGALSDTATISFVISDTTTTSTTTTTISYMTFFDDTRNIAWFTVSIIIFLTCFGFLVYILCTCNGANSCTKPLKVWRSGGPVKTKKPKEWRPSSVGQGRIEIKGVRNPPPHWKNQSWRSEIV